MKRFVVAVGGATGAIYASRLLSYLKAEKANQDLDVDLVFTAMGRVCWRDELGIDPESFGFRIYGARDFTAPFASGSAIYAGMAVVPCSSGCLARIATGVSTDLVTRAGDVMLKERRPLILVHRETPLSLVQLRAMTAVTEAGAIVMPASPSFYSHPPNFEALADTVVTRILDHLGVENQLMDRWDGTLKGPGGPP
jgi:flavin prenyltransferase